MDPTGAPMNDQMTYDLARSLLAAEKSACYFEDDSIAMLCGFEWH